MHFRFTAALCAAVLLAVAGSTSAQQATVADTKLLEKAKEIHRRIIAFDSHLDLPFDYPGELADGKTQFDLPKVARGELKGAALAVFVPQGPRNPQGYAQARADAEKKYNLIKAITEQNPSLAAQAYSPADVQRIAEQGKFAVVMSLLNAYPLGADLSQIDEWYRRGVRIFGYTHAGHNQWADSSRPNQARNKLEPASGILGFFLIRLPFSGASFVQRFQRCAGAFGVALAGYS
jgi:membrane dipeptidase